MAPGPYLEAIPDRHLVRFISIIISNRSFTLKTSDGQVGRLRRLENGVPPGSVLAPTLFNIYLSDLLSTSSSKYAYAGDFALLYFDRNWTTVKLDGSTLSYNSTPISLRVKLDRQLTFKLHIEALRGKWRQGITFYVVLLVRSGELTHVLRLRT